MIFRSKRVGSAPHAARLETRMNADVWGCGAVGRKNNTFI